MKYQHIIDVKNEVSKGGETVNLISTPFEAKSDIEANDIVAKREITIIRLQLFRYFESRLIKKQRIWVGGSK